jgi:DNA modification methylase
VKRRANGAAFFISGAFMRISKAATRASTLARTVHLAINERKIVDLVPSPNNPRVHSPRQIQQIARSIATFGFNAPILIDSSNRIVCGHGRVEAAKSLGIDTVPTIRLDHLSAAEAKAFLLADNRLAEQATWNDGLLAVNFAELLSEELTFDLTVTGWEIAEIDGFVIGDAATSAAIEDETPVEIGPAVTKSGDLWILGDHRVLCANALEPASYERLLQGEKAAIAVADFPYNVPIAGHVGGNGKIQHPEFAMASGEMSDAEFRAFLSQACALMVRYSVDGAIHYNFMDWRSCRILQEAADPHYGSLKNIVVWQKDSAGMGSFYRSQHEFVFVYKVGNAPHQNNIQLGKYGRNRSNVWVHPGANSFARSCAEGNLLAYHPTSKPVALIADALLDASSPRDIVLDPFAGAGATLLAAERTGRFARTIEIDGPYVDTTIRRWQRMTKKAAVNAASHCTFDELEEQGGHRG